MKASSLLRAWLLRLAGLGVTFRPRHRWTGRNADGTLGFATDRGPVTDRPTVTLLALGGGSWPRLGSDGHWATQLQGLLAPFRPANCGFRVDWSVHLRTRFAGTPLKRIAISFGDVSVRGEAVITATGLEGGAIYAVSDRLRDAIEAEGSATIRLDLRPDLSLATLQDRLGGPRRGQSLANTLRKQADLAPKAIGLVQEALHQGEAADGPR
jgi:hypothetical protein